MNPFKDTSTSWITAWSHKSTDTPDVPMESWTHRTSSMQTFWWSAAALLLAARRRRTPPDTSSPRRTRHSDVLLLRAPRLAPKLAAMFPLKRSPLVSPSKHSPRKQPTANGM